MSLPAGSVRDGKSRTSRPLSGALILRLPLVAGFRPPRTTAIVQADGDGSVDLLEEGSVGEAAGGVPGRFVHACWVLAKPICGSHAVEFRLRGPEP